MARGIKFALALLLFVTSVRSDSDCDTRCRSTYQPVCAKNGVTYDNRCELRRAQCRDSSIEERYEGVCPVGPNSSPSSNRNNARPSVQQTSSSNRRPSGSSSSSSQLSGSSSSNARPSVQQTSSSNRRPSGSSSSSSQSSGSSIRRPSVGNVVIGAPVQPITSSGRLPASAPAAPSVIPQAPPNSQIQPVVNTERAVRNCRDNCTPGFRPVCGTDGQVYESECKLRVAICKNPRLGLKNQGVCRRDCTIECPLEIQYVCGTDGKTYVNDCELTVARCKDSSIRKVGDGPCAVFRETGCQRRDCERVYTPVCGSDGVTYENMCQLQNQAACEDNSLLRLHEGECKAQRCRTACRRDGNLVCGSDGITYPNHCVLIGEACRLRSSVLKVKDGPC